MTKPNHRARLAKLRGQEPYKEVFPNAGKFLSAVVEAADRGWADADHRLEFSAVATGANNILSEGGFIVPNDTAADWWTATYDTGQLLGRTTRFPVTKGDKLTLPAVDEISRADGSRTGGLRMQWVGENTAVSETKPKYRSMTLHPKKLLGLAYVTGELLADAPALELWMRNAFAQEASFAIEDTIINGTGAGRPLGVLKSEALITVAKESGQSASTVLAANLQNMIARLWGPSRRSAIWLTNNDALAQVEGLSFSNGKPVVTYDANGNPRILGRPVILDEYTATLGTLGDVILMDPSQYLIGEKEPGIASSVHVRFLFDEGVFRFRYRLDGQPAWKSPITPRNSAITQSPFITLATRA